MERAYAQALWNMVAAGGDHAASVKALAESLKRTGRLNLMPKISLAFARIAAREEARTGVRITAGRSADAKAALAASGLKEADVVVDPDLIGGYRIEKGDTLIDASWKRHLINLYNAVTAA